MPKKKLLKKQKAAESRKPTVARMPAAEKRPLENRIDEEEDEIVADEGDVGEAEPEFDEMGESGADEVR